MRYNEAFIATQREKSQGVESVSHDLILRAGIAYQVAAGFYDFLPLGQRVINRVENIVREEMNKRGALEISMPIIQPAELWVESGRWGIYGKEMFRLKNRDNRDFCLGPTHEELVCQLVRSYLRSYRQLPFNLYQIGRKFRDEVRPRHGPLRAREFLMKDAYSFDADEQGLDISYQKMRDAYINIFKELELEAVPVSADPGEMGGAGSEEFLAPAEFGEDLFIIQDGKAHKAEHIENNGNVDIRRGIEVGHIFKLGDRYSKPMNVKFSDKDGAEKFALMGCYGMGVSRLISALLEQHHDTKGVIWPTSVAPYDVEIMQLGDEDIVRRTSEDVYNSMREKCIDVLFDDRNVGAGVKFRDADLIGVPYKLVVGSKNLSKNHVEYETRKGGKKTLCAPNDVVDVYMRLVKE